MPRPGPVTDEVVVRGLTAVSLGMGLTLLAPERAASLFGLGPRPRLMVAIGARDLLIGLGLLGAPSRRPWLLAHAAACVVDGTLVALAVTSGRFPRWRGRAWAAFAFGSAALALGIR